MKGRGQATRLTYPKKPYKIQFDEKLSLFGWSADKDYVLLANYTDKSLLRNTLGFLVSETVELDWTPKSQFVELILNDVYQGVYTLAESVKGGKNRVNVGEDGFMVEMNYSLEYETNSDVEHFFQTTYNGLYFTFQIPNDKKVTTEDVNYAQGIMEKFTSLLNTDECVDMIDVDQFARWWYVMLVLQNTDTNLYFKKENSLSKLSAGPVWDFEWSLGTGAEDGNRYPADYMSPKSIYYELCDKPVFREKLVEIHRLYRDRVFENVLSAYDDYSSYLREPAARNYKTWNVLTRSVCWKSSKPLGTWDRELNADRRCFLNRMFYLDKVLK